MLAENDNQVSSQKEVQPQEKTVSLAKQQSQETELEVDQVEKANVEKNKKSEMNLSGLIDDFASSSECNSSSLAHLDTLEEAEKVVQQQQALSSQQQVAPPHLRPVHEKSNEQSRVPSRIYDRTSVAVSQQITPVKSEQQLVDKLDLNRRISQNVPAVQENVGLRNVTQQRSDTMPKQAHPPSTISTFNDRSPQTVAAAEFGTTSVPQTEAKMVGAMSFRSRRDLTERGKSMDIVAGLPKSQKNTFISRAQDIVLSQMSESQEDISAAGNSFVDFMSMRQTQTAKKDQNKEPVIIEWDQTADEKNGKKYDNKKQLRHQKSLLEADEFLSK